MKTDWSMLCYFAADNELSGVAIDELNALAAVGSSQRLGIALEVDRPPSTDGTVSDWSGCRRYVLGPPKAPGAPLAYTSLGAIDSGDAKSLRDFLEFGVDACDAGRRFVVLWGHGTGTIKLQDKARGGAEVFKPLRRPGFFAETRARFDTSSLFKSWSDFDRFIEAHVPATDATETQSLEDTIRSPQDAGPSKAAAPVEPGLEREVAADPPQNIHLAPLDDPPRLHAEDITRLRAGIDAKLLAHGFTNHQLYDFAFDYSSASSIDTVSLESAVSSVLSQGRRFDVVGFDACFMMGIEIAYELRHTVGVLVGCEGPEPTRAWPYGAIARVLSETAPRIDDPRALGAAIVDRFAQYHAQEELPFMALDLSKLQTLVDAVNDLAAALLLRTPTASENRRIRLARAKTRGFYQNQYCDLRDFALRLVETFPGTDVETASRSLIRVFDDSTEGPVIASRAAIGGAYGLSIALPKTTPPAETYGALAFAKDTRWFDLLRALPAGSD